MEARILTDEQEIIEAKKLAYEVLVKEQKWEIKPDNPSGLHIKDLPQGKVLWDDYDTVATRLGVFEENTLVGCLRICGRLNGKFELEHYHSLLDFIHKDELAVEITRIAVWKKYRFSMVILLLFRLTYESLLEKGGYAWGTGFWPNPGKLYVNKFGATRHEIPFRYYSDDPQEVYLYYINGYDRPYISKMISEFNLLLARKEKIRG
ncbi:MAG: GNAT family N-acetyltransferase [Okeania sp. SIO3B3]|nr:GNAT family N-acetyltransferase [Okeania sp. SIO3B3]